MDLQQKVLSVDLMDTGSNDKSMDVGNGDTKTKGVTSFSNPLAAELDEVQSSEDAQHADGEGESFDRGNGSNKSLASTSPKYGTTIVDEGNEGDVGTAMQAAKPSASESKRLQVCGGVKGRSSRYRQNHRTVQSLQ